MNFAFERNGKWKNGTSAPKTHASVYENNEF